MYTISKIFCLWISESFFPDNSSFGFTTALNNDDDDYDDDKSNNLHQI